MRLLGPAVPILFGLLALYLPSYLSLAQGYWRTNSGTHGPVMLMLILWLVWRERAVFFAPEDPVEKPLTAGQLRLAYCAIGIGLLCYYVGRSQSVDQLQIGSQLPLLLGLLALLTGRRGLRRLWFPVALLVFVVPVPGSILDSLLLTLKQLVSSVVTDVLYAAGYPMARSGVMLSIGQYRLSVANACSGLNSIVALSGIGVIYVYVVGHASRWANALLLASVLPVAFVANVIRVGLIVLITYHFGDAAGRSFHDKAGILEVIMAFGGFFLVDCFISLFARDPPVTHLKPT
ncbi:MAG: exosortase [Steroidobacteraceae bacterium]